MPDTYEVKLRHILGTKFNSSELKALCYDLAINYDDLPGEDTITNIAIELLTYCKRRDRLIELYEAVKKERPGAFDPKAEASSAINNSGNQMLYSRKKTPEEWLDWAVRASVHLWGISAAVESMLNREYTLCQLILGTLPELPEQQRNQIDQIIKTHCSGFCDMQWKRINMDVVTGTTDWKRFIEGNCTEEDCGYYDKRVEEGKARLFEDAKKGLPRAIHVE